MTSSDKHIHIIAFDVPFPADYGGAIDVFYKVRAFHEAGIKVHLHCFEYGRSPQKALADICEEVFYYPRKTARTLLFNTLPYIVLTRTSDELKKNLSSDFHPVLMEGLHSTFLLNDVEFLQDARDGNRKIIVRTHNVEHDYYENLAAAEHNVFKRYYFYNEAGKLKKYEIVLNQADLIAAISPNDTAYFSKHYSNVHYIPAFHPNKKVDSLEGKGEFAFYHGNLAVSENNEAALFLVTKVFRDSSIPLVIAGSKPSDELLKAVKENRHVELKKNISQREIHELIHTAQCNVLPTFQATGIKLKLLSSLFGGRFCIANKPMVENTGLENLCLVADSADEMQEKINSVSGRSFTKEDIEEREHVLGTEFSNRKNIEKLIAAIYSA